MLRFPAIVLLLTACIVTVGCGDSAKARVKGNVTFNGDPVEEGSISFLPAEDTQSRKASAAILNGVFDIPADRAPTPGKFKVEISWFKKTGNKIASADPGMVAADETKEAIPAKYNRETTLVRELVVGENKLDFKLDP